MPKNYAGTYLYGKYPNYDKALFEFIMKADIIDKNGPGFEDIVFDIKRRQISPAIVKVLESQHLILMSSNKPLPRQFKAFCAKDVRNGNKKDLKVYIDVSGIIYKDDETGKYRINVNKDIDRLLSYLVSAMTCFIYYKDENRLIGDSTIASSGAKGFAECIVYILDYVAKISSTSKTKNYCKYISAMYFISNILGKDYTTNSNLSSARKIAGLSEREAEIVDMQLTANSFDNVKTFAETLSNILKVSKFSVDVLVERWMYLFGTSTVFALELFPAFATMMSDCYIGAYLNNQKTLEKIMGSTMVEFNKRLLSIGAEAV